MSPTVTVIVAVIVGLVLIGIVWAIVSAVRSTTSDSFLRASRPVPDAQDRLRPKLVDFHVKDDHGEDLLRRAAPRRRYRRAPQAICSVTTPLSCLHEKRAHGLPIEQVVRAEVFGRAQWRSHRGCRAGTRRAGCDPRTRGSGSRAPRWGGGYDPLAHLGEQEFEIQPGSREQRAQGRDSRPSQRRSPSRSRSRLRTASRRRRSVQHALSDLSLSLARDRGLSGLAGIRRTANTPCRPEGRVQRHWSSCMSISRPGNIQNSLEQAVNAFRHRSRPEQPAASVAHHRQVRPVHRVREGTQRSAMPLHHAGTAATVRGQLRAAVSDRLAAAVRSRCSPYVPSRKRSSPESDHRVALEDENSPRLEI